MGDKDHYIIVAGENQRIVVSCACVIIPNLIHRQRIYAFVEHIIAEVKHTEKEDVLQSVLSM